MKALSKIFLTCATLLATVAVNAQADLQNNGILSVTSGSDIVYINGAFTNAATATFTNNGNLYVRQTLTNGQASMTVGTGTLYLNGITAQAIAGTQPFKTYNLITDNASGITLNNNLSVSGLHTFVTGIIFSSVTPNYLAYEAGSSYSGDGDSRHVKGWITKTGTTAFVYPLGNGTVERTIGSSGLSVAAVFNANYTGVTTNTSNLAAPLVSVDPNEYWTVNRISGGSAIIDMNWDNSKVAMPGYPLASIRVANYLGGNWTDQGGSATGSISSTGNISSASISSFGAFTFGSLSFTLPVHLVEFDAVRANDKTILNWYSEDEVNVSHYSAQRSNDGLQFYEIAKVAARNLASRQQYTCADNTSLNGTAYYRLRSVDLDGKSSLSKIVVVTAGNTRTMSVINPVYSNIHINYAGADGVYGYKITNLSGQTIQEGDIALSASGGTIPLRTVNKGVYILQVQKRGFNFVQKIQVH